MMYAVIAWCDGFGYDTLVTGIYKDFEEACKHARSNPNSSYPDKIVAFNFGEVDWDYYEIEDVRNPLKKKKKRSRKKKER